MLTWKFQTVLYVYEEPAADKSTLYNEIESDKRHYFSLRYKKQQEVEIHVAHCLHCRDLERPSQAGCPSRDVLQ